MSENANKEYTFNLTIGDLKNIAILIGAVDKSMLEISEQDIVTINNIKTKINNFLASINESLLVS